MRTQTQAPARGEVDALATPFSLSVLTVTKGSASKQLLVGAGGLPIKGQGSLAITAGMLEHVQVPGLTGLAQLLTGICQNQALVHGVVKDSQPGEVHPLVTTDALTQAKPGALAAGTIARSLEHLAYPDDLFLLMLDRDDNPEDPTPITTAEALLRLLDAVLPGMSEAGRVVTTSTSSGIRAKATQEWLVPPNGFHVYLLVRGKLQRFVDLLSVRLWNAGYGYCKLATPNKQTGVAAVLVRAVVDLSVFSPERLDYVAGARIAKQAPFYQDRGAPDLREGGIVDLDAFPDVTPEERQDYTARVAAAKAALAPERFRLVKAVIEAQDSSLPATHVEGLVHQRLAHHDGGYLLEDVLLYFSHRKKAVAVKDLSADYDGLRLADPAEPSYRDGTDAIFHWRQGDWRINSFAHGLLQTYRAVPLPPPDPDEDDMQDLLARATDDATQHQNGHTPPSASSWRDGETPGPESTRQELLLPLSDYTNALAFVRDHQEDVRYCEAWKKWLIWTGTHWHYRAQGPIYQKAKQTIRALLHNASISGMDDAEYDAWLRHIKRSLSTAALEAMVKSAQNEPPLPIEHSALDCQRHRLACANVTVDLVTGDTYPHARKDLLTECLAVPYNPKATCPRWKAFLWQIFGGTPPEMATDTLSDSQRLANERALSLVQFLQRLCGLCLTGDVREQYLYVLYGTGANGKSTLLGILLALLCNYGMKAAPELLMASRDHDRHPTERADLFGKRLVAAIETEQGRRLNETLVKELTGGDPIRARRMREDFWEFRPTHKILLATNHKPQIRGTDHAIWRRVKLIPFTVTIPDEQQDPTLPETLLKELPGILAWCVAGCLDWQEHGLRIPAAVVDATESYRHEQDVFEEFLATECFRHASAVCASADLYAAYEAWCKRNDVDALSKRAFGMRLGEYDGLTPDIGTGGRRLWRGIGLPTPPREDNGREKGS